jgi:hypothetical protein
VVLRQLPIQVVVPQWVVVVRHYLVALHENQHYVVLPMVLYYVLVVILLNNIRHLFLLYFLKYDKTTVCFMKVRITLKWLGGTTNKKKSAKKVLM